MTAPNLAAPLRAAIIAHSEVVSLLPAYKGSYPVFTRRPVPADAPYPLIAISGDISSEERDGVSDQRIAVSRDIAVYAKNDSPDSYRNAEVIAYALRDILHRQRATLTVEGWHVVQVTVRGPFIAPTDDETTVGRIVTLNALLARL